MITVSKLVGRSACAEELSNLKLWDMDVEDVMPAHLQGFFYRSKLRTNREVAKNCANFIANAINEANQNHHIRNDRLKVFSVSEPPYLSGELRQSLSQLSVPARRCVYFSLLMGWSIEQAIELTWSEVSKLIDQGYMFHQDAAMDVLDALPRHFKNPLVFWEDMNGTPKKLSALKYDIESIFNCTYEELLEKFQSMVLVDSSLHANELKTIWGTNNG